MHIKLKSRKTKLLRIVLIVLLLNFASVYFIINSNIFVISPLDSNSNSINLPKTSDNEITLKTPENKTYLEPMNGYYPALHGFENDDDGSDPAGFNVHEGAGYVNVISTKNSHTKVVEMYDGSSSDHTELHNIFQPQSSGTIEFWMLDEDVSDTFSIIFLDDTATSVWGSGIGWIQIWQDKIRYLDNTDWYDTSKVISDNTWYHLKIEFECTSGNYQGLSQNTWRFYVDGESFGDQSFFNDVNNVSQIYFATRGADNSYKCFVDAIGYSWDSTYTTGDNLNEGLLLGFEKSISLDWIGFSLDGLSNKTIIGNTTLPLPPNGQHHIQVYGNDSLNNMYASNLMYFTIAANINITINTPENKIYTEPMSGYYPGTYGFEDDILNSFPYDWIDNDVSTCETKVSGEIYGHNNVVQQYDNHGSAAAQMNKDIPATSIITVEFWVRTDLLTLLYFNVRDSSITYNSWDLRNLSGFSVDTWHHVRFVINTMTDKYDSYLDEVLKNNQDNLPNPMNDVDQIQFNTAPSQINYNVWWDAIGGNWDPNYNIGDNLKEGLLLSYENSTNLDWIGYSLDGSSNITITGNKVITFPEIGIHSLILSGITSTGVLIKSNLRYFTTSNIVQDPPILPNNPNLIPIILTSVGIGIIVLFGITLLLFRRKIWGRTSSTIISHRKSQSDDKAGSGSYQYKICPLCHTRIKKTDQFCEFCGVSLKND